MPDKPPDEWVTIPEAAGLTGKSERTIHRYIADGSLSNRREKGRLLVSLADILESEPVMPDTPSTPGISGKLLEEYHAGVWKGWGGRNDKTPGMR